MLAVVATKYNPHQIVMGSIYNQLWVHVKYIMTTELTTDLERTKISRIIYVELKPTNTSIQQVIA